MMSGDGKFFSTTKKGACILTLRRVPKGCTSCIVKPQCSKNSRTYTNLLLQCVPSTGISWQ